MEFERVPLMGQLVQIAALLDAKAPSFQALLDARGLVLTMPESRLREGLLWALNQKIDKAILTGPSHAD